MEAAISSIYDWSSTAGSNTSVGGINIAEGMSPALVNDAIRALMAIARATFDPSLQNFLNNSAQLPIANGGTGAATATAALAALGGLSSAYQDLPIVVKSTTFAFANSERGGGILFNGSSPTTGTINTNATTPINVGAVYAIHNGGGATLTIAPFAGVSLFVNGAITSANATLALGANATLIQWSVDIWMITGVGVS